MKNFNKIFLGILIVSFFQACETEQFEKEIEANNLPTFADYYDLLTQQTDGDIVIQSSVGIGSQDGERNNSIQAYFEKRTSLPNVKVGGLVLNKSNTEQMLEYSEDAQIAQLFGTKVFIDVQDPVARLKLVQSEMYIPDLLTIANQIDRLKVGDEIEWNSDAANVNGLILRFEYQSLSQTSQAIAEQYPDDIIDGFIVPDGGSIILTQEMLNSLPSGADINITIARGNIELLPVSNDEVYKVGGVTSISTRATVME